MLTPDKREAAARILRMHRRGFSYEWIAAFMEMTPKTCEAMAVCEAMAELFRTVTVVDADGKWEIKHV